MKLFTLLIIVLLAIVAWPKAKQVFETPPAPAPPESAPAPPDPAPAPPQYVAPERAAQTTKKVSPPRTQWKRDELIIVHGKVIERRNNVAHVQCTSREYDGLHRVAVPENLGGGDGSRLGQKAIDSDMRTYGPLQMVGKDGVVNSVWTPRNYARGIIDLHGCLAAPGATVHMVAAPISNTEYTTVFEIDEPADAWMWRGGGKALDSRGK